MTTKYNTAWIAKTAQEMFEITIKYNYRFTLEKAVDMATKRARELNEALNNPTYKIDEHDNIIQVYDFNNVQSLDSIYGCHAYCGD